MGRLLAWHFWQRSHEELENLLLEREAELVALQLEDAAERGVAAEEDGHLALPLLLDLGEHLVPVGASCVRPRLQSGHQVALLLQDEIRIRSENYICTICGARQGSSSRGRLRGAWRCSR